MADSAATLESLDEKGRGIRVVFTRLGDRFGHTIFGIAQDQTTPLLRSIEGTSEDVSPPSPPFAELHQQGEVLFLSGATTIGHWSMSVQVAAGRLLFDVACRLKDQAFILGSEYQAVADPSSDQFSVVVEQHPESDFQSGGILHRLSAETGLDRISCVQKGPFEIPATIRWCYTISDKAEA